jgi:Zn finger protein HypA/HybF involved in hydrogenase expression
VRVAEKCEGCGINEWLEYHDYICPHCSFDNKKEESDEVVIDKYEQYCKETEEPLSFAKWFCVFD